MTMLSLQECHALMFRSYERVSPTLPAAYDQHVRDLTAMRDLFARARVPTHVAPAMTVTGSKGKGSTALWGAALLQAHGQRVGLLTSPHMLDVRERIRVDGQMIPADDYVRIVNHLAPHAAAVDAALPPGKYLSPTGMFLAAALLYFQEQGCTALVLEVGRGGRYDDVKLAHNVVSAFAPIVGEHLDRMGPAVTDIAWHKAGILKPDGVLASAPQSPDVAAVLEAERAALDARCAPETSVRLDGDAFVVSQPDAAFRVPRTTSARYQAVNLGTAAAAVRALLGYPLSPDAALLGRLRFAGRCERVNESPDVYVDGAIHRESAALFLDSVRDHVTRPLVLVTALPDDKDAEGVLNVLAPHADDLLVTQLQAAHLHFSDRTAALAAALHRRVHDVPDARTAFARALTLAGAAAAGAAAGAGTAGAGGTVWVVGTQSLVREALRFWGRRLDSIFS